MIAKFDLGQSLRAERSSKIRAKPSGSIARRSVDKKPNVVSVTCEDKDPKVAQAMTAYFGVVGNKILRHVSASSAGEERRFLEQRVVEARKRRQRRRGGTCASSRRSTTSSTCPSRAGRWSRQSRRLRGELLSKQLQLDYLHGFSSSDEATAAQLRRQVGVMQSKMHSLEDVPADTASRRRDDPLEGRPRTVRAKAATPAASSPSP